MRRTINIVLVICASALACLAVFETPLPEAQATAMGDFNPLIGTGPGSIFGEYGITGGAGYRRSFNYSDFDEACGWSSYGREKLGRFMVNVASYGPGDLTSETKISVGYSRPVVDDIHTKLSFGAVGNLNSLSYGKSVGGIDLGSGAAGSFDIAAEAIIYDRTKVRLLAENITSTNMGVEGDVELPRAVTGLIGYSPYNNTEMMFYVRREASLDYNYGLGISVAPHEMIVLRLGAATNPDRVTGGIGLKYKMVHFDYALKSNPVLPMSHTISLGVEIGN